MVVGEARSLP